MKIRDVMSHDPICCLPTDTAQKVAEVMRERNIGSVPVVLDHDSRKLVGMITDRDLCCSVVASGLDPKTTTIEKFLHAEVVSCRDGENITHCEKAMQDHQIRRVPIVDGDDRVIGVVSQADLALKEKPEMISKTVAEISKSRRPSVAA